MTAETTTRVPLADAAKATLARQTQDAKARAAEKRQHYIRDAKAAGQRIGVQVLGDYGRDVEWTPEGEQGDRWLQATATIDGLRFRATERYYSAGDFGSGYERTLYLRQPCPNGEPGRPQALQHEPADRELEIHGLADLGSILANPEQWESARCSACQQARHEAAEEAEQHLPPAPPPTVEERLAGVLREYVDSIVGERLPDRV